MKNSTLATTTLLALAAGAVAGQPIQADFASPDRDRWNYPFNFSPGVRTIATVFGAADQGIGFDDRDAQFVVGWDTASQIPAGESAASYQITSARITAYIAVVDQFVYDPSYDSFQTHLLDGDAQQLPDADPGRPIEMFPAGYRDGFDLSSWTEFTTFGTALTPPAQDGRNIFPANFDALGTPFNISNNVKDRLETNSAAIGQMPSVTPGAVVPLDTQVVFDLDLSDPRLVSYLQESLAVGKLNMVVSSLHLAVGGPDGGSGDPQYPAFYTKEDPIAGLLGLTPTLELTVEVGNPIDFNGDGFIDNGDISAFVSLFIGGDPAADVNGDGIIDNGDIGAFVTLFLAAAG